MNSDYSAATPDHEYTLTIIDNRALIKRLAVQLAYVGRELKQTWREFEGNPIAFGAWAIANTSRGLRQLLSRPNLLPAVMTAFATIICAVAIVLLLSGFARTSQENLAEVNEQSPELVLLDLPAPREVMNESGIGDSASPRAPAMGGGNHDPHPPQAGKLPPPSLIPAAIPISPPLTAPSLPVAGINIDPAVWKDLDAKVFGDPNSTSKIPSSGPGDGGGIGTGKGTGIGSGDHGVNLRDGGDCGGIAPGQGSGIGSGGCAKGNFRPFRASEVEQKARILSKPEPQYTEEARRNQVTGTVMLRVTFSSSGEVVQIRAMHTLPFGLTEQAIAAARRIKFVPATKGGQPVSVAMQLEYNFNLY